MIPLAVTLTAVAVAAALTPYWLERQGAEFGSLLTREFWFGQSVLAASFIRDLALPWGVIWSGMVVTTALILLVGWLRRRGTKRPVIAAPATSRRKQVIQLATSGRATSVIARETGLARDAIRSVRDFRAVA
jgi:hypothetical protein